MVQVQVSDTDMCLVSNPSGLQILRYGDSTKKNHNNKHKKEIYLEIN